MATYLPFYLGGDGSQSTHSFIFEGMATNSPIYFWKDGHQFSHAGGRRWPLIYVLCRSSWPIIHFLVGRVILIFYLGGDGHFYIFSIWRGRTPIYFSTRWKCVTNVWRSHDKFGKKTEPKPSELRPRSEKNRRKIDEKSTKNDGKWTKNWFRPSPGALGRSGSRQGRAETRSGRPPDGKLGRLGRQVGRLGRHVGRFGRKVGSPGRSKRRSEPSQSPLRTRA